MVNKWENSIKEIIDLCSNAFALYNMNKESHVVYGQYLLAEKIINILKADNEYFYELVWEKTKKLNEEIDSL